MRVPRADKLARYSLKLLAVVMVSLDLGSLWRPSLVGATQYVLAIPTSGKNAISQL